MHQDRHGLDGEPISLAAALNVAFAFDVSGPSKNVVLVAEKTVLLANVAPELTLSVAGISIIYIIAVIV